MSVQRGDSEPQPPADLLAAARGAGPGSDARLGPAAAAQPARREPQVRGAGLARVAACASAEQSSVFPLRSLPDTSSVLSHSLACPPLVALARPEMVEQRRFELEQWLWRLTESPLVGASCHRGCERLHLTPGAPCRREVERSCILCVQSSIPFWHIYRPSRSPTPS